jgi:hypothetical protein
MHGYGRFILFYKIMHYVIQKQKIDILNGLVAVMSFVSILIIHIIRAVHLRLNHFPTLLLGISPNFFASFAAPFLLIVLVDKVPTKRMVINVSLLLKKLVFYCFIVSLGLLVWEFIQNIL